MGKKHGRAMGRGITGNEIEEILKTGESQGPRDHKGQTVGEREGSRTRGRKGRKRKGEAGVRGEHGGWEGEGEGERWGVG